MDLTPHIPVLLQGKAELPELMQGSSTVACMGSRALLSLFVCAAPFPESLMGAVTTEMEALAMVHQHRPTFLFATERLEQGDGLSLVQQAQRLLPELRSLLILEGDDLPLAQRAIEVGCNGVVVERQLAEGAMVQAIRAVVGGGLYIDRRNIEALRSSDRGSGPAPLEPLSQREQEVLQLVLQGFTNREMGAALGLSPETIKTHVANILGKLQARDRTQAAVIGLRLGLVSWP
jgi:DNA-binding NarL/FixJ family response regulator